MVDLLEQFVDATDVAGTVLDHETVAGLQDNSVAEGTDVVRGAIARVSEASALVGETAAAVLTGADEVVERNAELRENVSEVTRELLASHDVRLALAS